MAAEGQTGEECEPVQNMCLGSRALSGACSVCCVLIDTCSMHVVAVEKINEDWSFKSLLVWRVSNARIHHEARLKCERAGAARNFGELCCEVGWGARVYDPAIFVVCHLHAGPWPASCLFPVAHWLPAVAAELACWALYPHNRWVQVMRM